jgi:alpha-beta hydrolase superfamily lysophospholipase
LLSSSESVKQRELAARCTAAGMAYFRFDHRGCGRSQGDAVEVTSFEGRMRDLAAAVETVRARTDIGGSLGLFGSSMGGAVCLAAARALGADVVVAVAAPVRSRGLRPFSQADDSPRPAAGRWIDFDITESVRGLRHALICHGDADEVVPFDHAFDIVSKLAPPKRLIRQGGGDHLMSSAAHQKQFMQEAVRWLTAQLKPSKPA